MEQVERGLKQAEVDGRRKAEEVQTVKNKVGSAHLFVRVWPKLRLLRVSVNVCVGGWGLGVQSEGYNIYYFSLWWAYYFLLIDLNFLWYCELFVCETGVIESDWSCQGQCEPRDNCLVHCFKPQLQLLFPAPRVLYFVPLHCVALSPVLWNKSSSHHVTITNCTCPHQDRNANYYESVSQNL